MLLLDHVQPIPHEAVSLFYSWEFWVAAATLLFGIIGSYVKQMIAINTLKINLKNIDEKHDARINSLKERVDSDRESVKANQEKIYDLCKEIIQRVSNLEGVLKNSNR